MKLSKRETIIVGASAVAVLGVIVYSIITPFVERSEKRARDIIKAQKDLQIIDSLKDTYLAQKKAIEKINRKLKSGKKKFALFSFLEDMAKKSGIKKNIGKMRPSESKVGGEYKESSVELKVDKITIDQLVNYLFRIEQSEKLLNVKRLKLKRDSKSLQFIDVTFEVSTFELISGKEKKS